MGIHANRITSLPEPTSFLGRARAGLTSTIAMTGIAGLSAIAVVLMGGSSANAWGPERTTFTMNNPAPYATFNSITNNPDVGDERNFLRVRDADKQYWGQGTTNGWTDTISNLQEGHTYEVRLYVHNNGEEGKYMAENVRASINLPTGDDVYGKQFEVNGKLSSSNARPSIIWDNIVLKSEKAFHVKVVRQKYYNNLNTEVQGGFNLGNELFGNAGAKLGYDQMNGYINSCLPFSGYVLVKFQPVFQTGDQPTTNPGYDIKKVVDDDGWSANTGSAMLKRNVKYTITVTNTGDTEIANLAIAEAYPAHATDIKVTYPNKGSHVITGDLVGDGSIGTIVLDKLAVGEKFEIKVELAIDLSSVTLQCGPNYFFNAVAGAANGGKLFEDTYENNIATTVIDNDCSNDTPNPTPTPDPEKPENPQTPGVPSAGAGVKTAVISLGLFLFCAAVLTFGLLRRKHLKK